MHILGTLPSNVLLSSVEQRVKMVPETEEQFLKNRFLLFSDVNCCVSLLCPRLAAFIFSVLCSPENISGTLGEHKDPSKFFSGFFLKSDTQFQFCQNCCSQLLKNTKWRKEKHALCSENTIPVTVF